MLNHAFAQLNRGLSVGAVGSASERIQCWSQIGKQVQIDIFLRKVPLKQAAATIYSFQRMAGRKGKIPKLLKQYPQVEQFWNLDLSWMDKHFPPALELLPEKYRDSVKNNLAKYCESMDEPYPIIGFDLYPNITD